jgi:hypothetical protein
MADDRFDFVTWRSPCARPANRRAAGGQFFCISGNASNAVNTLATGFG